MKDVDIFKAVKVTEEVLYLRNNDDYNHAVGDALESVLRYFGLYGKYCEWSEEKCN